MTVITSLLVKTIKIIYERKDFDMNKMYNFNVNQDYMKGTYSSANEAWYNLYIGLNKFGDESSPRGQKVRETLECDIKILHPEDNLVYSKARCLSPYYIAGEYYWYKSGSNKVKDIYNHSKFWDKIQNEDENGNPNGTVNSGYGYYIFRKDENGVSNFDKIIKSLSEDNDTRQAVLQIPITRNIGKKDTPCTSSVQFILRHGKLNCTVYMRSNDIWLGFPYDVFNFTMWQLEIAKALGVEVGWYRHVVGSLHVYERHFMESLFTGIDAIDNCIENESNCNKMCESFFNDLKLLNSKNDQGIVTPILRKMIINYKFIGINK